MISQNHQAALDCVAAGTPVITAWPDTKRPAMKFGKGQRLRTVDEVNAAWAEQDYVPLLVPEDTGLCVVDDDTARKGGTPWDGPPTFTVRTGQGGFHYYYAGSLPPSVGKLGENIDTRGRQSYVVAPGAQIEGRSYEVVSEVAPAALPGSVRDQLARPDARASVSAGEPVTADQLKRLLSFIDPAADYGTWIKTLGAIHATNLVDGDNLEIAKEWSHGDYHGEVPPNWDSDATTEGFFTTVPPRANGWGFGTIAFLATEGGYEGSATRDTKTNAETFATALAGLPTGEPEAKFPLNWRDGAAVLASRPPDISLLVGSQPYSQSFPFEKGLTIHFTGVGGLGKSSLMLQLGMTLENGGYFLGKFPTTQTTVVLVHYEDRPAVIERRVQALRAEMGVERTISHFCDRSGDHVPLAVVGEGVRPTDFYDALRAKLREIPGHKVLILDSFVNAFQFLGNTKFDEQATYAAFKLLDDMAAECDLTIIPILHPSRAGAERGDSGWNVAFDNQPRQKISMNAVKRDDKKLKQIYKLRVDKWSNGPDGQEIEITRDGSVFRPISKGMGAEVREVVGEASEFGKEIGRALLEMGITGDAEALSSGAGAERIIAQKMAPRWQHEGDEEYEERVARITDQIIRQRGHTAYAVKAGGRGPWWWRYVAPTEPTS